MRKLLLLVSFASLAFAQPKYPILSGSGGTAPYAAPFSAATGTGTITGATHGQGARPVVESCYTISGSTKTPFTDYTAGAINAIGDFAITWLGSRTGECLVSSGKGGVGYPGPAGASGVTPWTAPAVWSSVTTYTAGPPASTVTYNGETYVAAGSSTNVVPGTDGTKWTKVSAKGTNGSNGADGAAGRDSLPCSITFSGQTTRTITAGSVCSDGGSTHGFLAAPTSIGCVDGSGSLVLLPFSVSGTALTIAPGVAFTGTCRLIGTGAVATAYVTVDDDTQRDLAATGSQQKYILVKSSAYNSGNQTLYTYDGAGGVYWVASTRIN